MNYFPNDRRFAFSIFDDTDLGTVENVSPVYRLLDDAGIYTTKSVWPLASSSRARLSGASLQEPGYRDFILQLRDRGFEIALHNVRNITATRRETERGLEEFRRLVGCYPRVHTNHCNNRDNIYWGAARFSSAASSLYRVATLAQSRTCEGHCPGSKYFWGDLCKERIDYVRNLVFRGINTQQINPSMPYHEPSKPFVNAWFSSADGRDCATFCNLLSEANQDRLEAQGGTCIVYTHFASGFSSNGRVHPRVEELLHRLAKKNGWFVPVSTLLDFLRQKNGGVSISAVEIEGMEKRWFADRMTVAAAKVLRLPPWSGRRPWRAGGSKRNYKSIPRARKRVLHITSAHSSNDVRIFYKECRSLARAGYEVLELTTDPVDSYVDGVEIIGVGPSRGRLHRMTAKCLVIGREALRLKADIYHIHDPELLPLALLLRFLGRPVIYDIHEDLPRTFLYKHYIPNSLRSALVSTVEFLENIAARGMTGLIAATPAIAERFKAIHSRTEVVSNYPDASELVPVKGRPWSERKRSITYIGGIAEERGIREILGAMERLRNSGATLEVAGWFADPLLQREILARPDWQNVVWRGLLDRNGIADLLGNVRAGLTVLHPERNFVTSQPVKMFEYMAAGIPVIASDFPLWRDLIEANGCGLLVDALDPQSIANAISYILTHPEEAEEMGKRGRAAVEQHFNWLVEERKLLGLYNSIPEVTMNHDPLASHEPCRELKP
jgi:glycosyltransferase involved in cell wall biosynthesis